MATVIYSSLGDLERDLKLIATEFKPRMAEQVKGVSTDGNKTAKRLAKRTAGEHGKHYPNSFTEEAVTPLQRTWGPDASLPQGGMSFEGGSRNQPPHHDIANAADLHGADDLQRRATLVLDRLFWP